MKITQAHLTWYRYKKSAKAPAWAAHLENDHPPSIHYLINTQSMDGLDRDYTKSNLLSILRSSRKRGKLRESMRGMVESPGCVTIPGKRRAMCRKWLHKIEN